jgi:hypothetical protein
MVSVFALRSNLVDIFQATVEKEPIRAMEISRRRRMLYVTSDTGIRQIDLAMCSARYPTLPYYSTLPCRGNTTFSYLASVLGIRDILVRICIRGSLHLTNGSGFVIFVSDLQDVNKKLNFFYCFAYYFLNLHLHPF